MYFYGFNIAAEATFYLVTSTTEGFQIISKINM